LITVAMITMNEEGAVGKVIADIRAAVPDAEVLVVDSSKDRTPEIAEAAGARVIRQFPPQGYGRAMDLALRSAKGDVVVTLDCDDTYPVSMIRPMAERVLSGAAALVDGNRVHRKPEAMPWLNYAANRGFAALASVLMMRWVEDLHSGMRAYRKSLIDEMACDPSGPALPVELLLRPISMGRRVEVVPIDYRERVGASTMQPLPSAWWTLKRIVRVRIHGGAKG